MKKSFLLAAIALCTIFSAHAMDKCPVQFGTDDYLGKVADLITNSSSCYEASSIADACALGASGDVYTVSAAINRCKKDIPKMSAKDQATHDSLMQKCNDKYAHMEGTLYRSMNVFCQLSVAKLYNELLTPADAE